MEIEVCRHCVGTGREPNIGGYGGRVCRRCKGSGNAEDTNFGFVLWETRRKADLTQQELANAVGISFTYVSKLENGRTEIPPSEALVKELARVLNINADTLIRLSGRTIAIPIAEYERLKACEAQLIRLVSA